jgi:integrase
MKQCGFRCEQPVFTCRWQTSTPAASAWTGENAERDAGQKAHPREGILMLLLFVLAYHSACRSGELTNLRWD